MKKIACFLIVFFLLGMSVGFAEMSSYEPMEIDPRVERIGESPGLFEYGYRFEDVKFLRSGGIAYQVVRTEGEESKLHLYSGDLGGPYAHQAYPYLNSFNFNVNFLVEDAQGLLYFSDKRDVYAVDSMLKNEAVSVLRGYEDSYRAESKGESILYYPDKTFGKQGKMILPNEITVMKPQEGFMLSERPDFYFASDWDLLQAMKLEEGVVFALDFAETEDAIYALVDLQGDNYRLKESPEIGEGSDEAKAGRFEIVRFDMSFQENQERQESNQIAFEMTKRIPLSVDISESMALGFQFDGSDFLVSKVEGEKGLCTNLMRVDQTGDVFDSVLLPGVIMHLDVKSNQTLASVISPYQQDQGLFLIDWKGKSASGSPRALIAERTMHNQTLAVFRDKGYGLLRKEEPESGIVDYLAPLKTEEADVRLRIPLCDVLARLHENARYLEIVYREQRLDIPMIALDARPLLEQLPCETDATIELRLRRNEAGEIQITGELFVIEQVNEKTKVVHRLPISLP